MARRHRRRGLRRRHEDEIDEREDDPKGAKGNERPAPAGSDGGRADDQRREHLAHVASEVERADGPADGTSPGCVPALVETRDDGAGDRVLNITAQAGGAGQHDQRPEAGG